MASSIHNQPSAIELLRALAARAKMLGLKGRTAMTLNFVKGSQAWFAKVGMIEIYLPDHAGELDRDQVRVAEEIEQNLPSLQLRASSYLDRFVDRAKACGKDEEPWWLEEVEFRASAPVPRYYISFTLDGDDGGMWSVEMLVNNGEHRPVGFERRQG